MLSTGYKFDLDFDTQCLLELPLLPELSWYFTLNALQFGNPVLMLESEQCVWFPSRVRRRPP